MRTQCLVAVPGSSFASGARIIANKFSCSLPTGSLSVADGLSENETLVVGRCEARCASSAQILDHGIIVS